MLEPHYCRRDEVQRMLEKSIGLHDHQQIKLALLVMHFLDIVKQTNMNTLQLKTAAILTFWWKIFQQSKAWNALNWLWDGGVFIRHSQSRFWA